MHARLGELIIVEIEVGIIRAHPTGSEPVNAAVAKKHVLTTPSMVGAISVTDGLELVMIRLVGDDGNQRRLA